MASKKSLLGRVVILIGLSFFTVELAILAVFTFFQWTEMREKARDGLDRHALAVRERVRAALLELGREEGDLDPALDKAMKTGQAGSPAPGPSTHTWDEHVEVWVFTREDKARRFSAGQLLSPEESGWGQQVVPAGVQACLDGTSLAPTLEERPELIARVEPIASGRDGPPAGALYLRRLLQDQQRQVLSFAGAAFAAGAAAVLFTAVVTMLYLRRGLLLPLSRIIRADVAARRGDEEKALVDAGDIPDDEIGAIMESRNELYRAMRGAQKDLDEKNAELAAQKEELRAWGRELERLVEEKTRALLRARDRLHRDEKLVALGRLAANVAHEINNPLASIAGYAEAGREDLAGFSGRAAEDVRGALLTIEEQAFRCKEILKRLLGLARAESVERVEVDLAALVNETLHLVRPGAERRQVELRLDLPDAGPTVLSEPGAIQQVVVNLVENAADAAAAGPARPAWLRVALEERGDRAAIVVADSGQGIGPDVLPRVFDPFYTTKPVGRGTGLGLAISQSLVERLGGTISVDSPAGSGAVFTVELPRRPEAISGRLPRQGSPASMAALRPAPERPAAAQSVAALRPAPQPPAPPAPPPTAPAPALAKAPPPQPPDPPGPDPSPPPTPTGAAAAAKARTSGDASSWLEAHLRRAGASSDPDS